MVMEMEATVLHRAPWFIQPAFNSPVDLSHSRGGTIAEYSVSKAHGSVEGRLYSQPHHVLSGSPDTPYWCPVSMIGSEVG